jgi:hypothetical protein
MWNFITSAVEYLSGKKTYIVGGLMIVLGLIQGDKQMILDGAGFIFLRGGVAKMQKGM